MKFIQISEPKSQSNYDNSENAIGIDLGTSNSVVSCYFDGKVRVLGPIVPSVVSYKSEGVVVGNEEEAQIRSIKRLMGKNKEEFNNHNIYSKNINPIEVSSKILMHLKEQAEAYLGSQVTKAVVTVPAYFDDSARGATKAAAKIAGLEVLRLINEPTAAALAYGLDNEAEGIYFIYDFGGGTFDVSILRMQKAVFEVIATGGDVHLGGDDIDKSIAEYLKLNSDNCNVKLIKEVKEYLSENEEWNKDGLSITREEFEDIAKPFITKTIEICKEAITQSGCSLSEIKEVILVGGSTRIPLVRRMVESFIKKPLDGIDPDLVVSMGAAAQADALVNGSNNLLLDVTSLSIGLEVMGGMNEKIIQKNSTIPLSVTKAFTTHEDGQTGMIFHIVQGEREMADDCRSLAKFELKGIPPMKAAAAKVQVAFNIDADGLLSVSAEEEITKVRQDIAVKPSYGLSAEEVELMIEESYINAQKDINSKKIAEINLAAHDNINNITQAIYEDGDLLKSSNKEEILSLVSSLKKLLDSKEVDSIKSAMLIEERNLELEAIASAFIQERLNRQIKQILQGKSPQNISFD